MLSAMETPAPPMSAPQIPSPPKAGWWSRNWKWFVPMSLVTLLLLCGGGIFAAVSMVFGLLKSSEPYKEALVRANASAQVQNAMGTPVEPGFIVGGSINLNNDSGTAILDIPVTGPKGKGSIHVDGTKAAGTWTYSAMDVTVEGQAEKISLLGLPPESP